MKVALAPRLMRQYSALSKSDQQLFTAAIDALPALLGIPTGTLVWECGPCGAGCMNVAPARRSESDLHDMAIHCCFKPLETTMPSRRGFGTFLDLGLVQDA